MHVPKHRISRLPAFEAFYLGELLISHDLERILSTVIHKIQSELSLSSAPASHVQKEPFLQLANNLIFYPTSSLKIYIYATLILETKSTL